MMTVPNRDLDRMISKRREWIVDANHADYKVTRIAQLDEEESRLRMAAARGDCLRARLSPDEVLQMKAYTDWLIEQSNNSRERSAWGRSRDDYVEFRVDHLLLNVFYRRMTSCGLEYMEPRQTTVVGPRWLSHFEDFRKLQEIMALGVARRIEPASAAA
jgi:hypothetical protein